MLSRLRSVGRRSAERLSIWYSDLGLPPVKRIPVFGRTRPDIEVNAFGLVVDEKSRKETPTGWYSFPADALLHDGHLYGIRLRILGQKPTRCAQTKPSLIVNRYFERIHKWTSDNVPNGVTGVVLHRRGTKFGSAVLVVYQIS